MALYTVQKAASSGTTPTYNAVAASDTFSNDGKTYLHVKNGSGGSINVTMNSITACDQGFDHDIVVAVPAGQERIIGPFPMARFNDANGIATVSYSATATITAACVSVG